MSMQSRPPNLVYILADDMGYGDLSCLNEESKINTVHLDRMAREGMIFRDAHASSAVCTPSRYSILTGRYNWRSALKEGVTFGYDKPIIEKDRMTVASFLKKHGYHTTCIGKWHLGWNWAMREAEVDFRRPIVNGPTDWGFNSFFGISASLDMPPYVYVENDKATASPSRIIAASEGKSFWREGPIAPDFKHIDVLPKLTEKAVEYIRKQSDRSSPFFLYFALPAPHTPILPMPEFQGKSGTNAYGDFCLQVDDVVGRIMAALAQSKVDENTIFIFTSDNGCSPMADFEELAKVGHNPSYIFRGHKADIYEGGHRIPFIVRWPKVIKSGTVTHQTVCLTDLFATCADVIGEKIPDNAGEDSISNLPVWMGKNDTTPLRAATIHSSIDGSLSIRQGHWKLEMCPGSGGWSFPKPGKECEGLPPLQLYDLRMDIGERKNISDLYPEIVKRLKNLLTEHIKMGRSTPGVPRQNEGESSWKQLWWM